MKKNEQGFVESITLSGAEYKFNGKGPALYGAEGLSAKLDITECGDYAVIHIVVKNTAAASFTPERMGVYLGVDCFMDSFPKWNDRLFPTMLRFEKTHFHGYFMSPLGQMLGIASDMPFASYELDYGNNRHRIDSVKLDILSAFPQPRRYPQNQSTIKAGETLERDIYLFSAKNGEELRIKAEHFTHAFIPALEKYTYEKGETVNIPAADASLTLYSPSGEAVDLAAPLAEYGLYTLIAEKNGKISEAYIYCRKPWQFYMEAARAEAIKKEQKATTHCESWYGLFSGYLAQKHFPNGEQDCAIDEKFNEIMPYMFDLAAGEPKVIPTRIQNTSAAVSLLVDKYEAAPEKRADSLVWACRLADFLLKAQRADGAFYGGYTPEGEHYTCVIYIAKSIFELYLAIRDIPEYKEEAARYYAAVKRAADNLVLMLDDIGTEGEQTFEDGMIACSALQIGMFALNLPQNERAEYVRAASCLIDKHACLEQNHIPDCRMRGGSLRFWESQFDVLTKPNMVSSPHGWTAWTLYAKYYVYLLTGKLKYLSGLMDGMGACAQLITPEGELRWAFVCDPCVHATAFVKDKKLKHGCSGKHVPCFIGEEYLDMISGWYKHEEQRITGGFLTHPLMLKGESIPVDNQGGCCDNDVHEIFKCMEETVLKKAFIHEKENGEYYLAGCKNVDGQIVIDDDVTCIVHTLKEVLCVKHRGATVTLNKSELPTLYTVDKA